MSGTTAPAIGVWVFSTTQRYEPDWPGDTANVKNGAVVAVEERPDDETGEVVTWLSVIQQHRGRVRYHHLRADECEYGTSGDAVNVRSVRALCQALNADMAARPGGNHLTALMALSLATGAR